MKQFKSIAILLLLTSFLFSASSCVVLRKKDNGKHKGWYKKQNKKQNPVRGKSNVKNNNYSVEASRRQSCLKLSEIDIKNQ